MSVRLVLASILACGLTHVTAFSLAQRPVTRASHRRTPETLRFCPGLRHDCHARRSRTIVAQASEKGMTLLEDKGQYDHLIADATKENRAAAGSIQGHGRHCHWLRAATVGWASSSIATGLTHQASW